MNKSRKKEGEIIIPDKLQEELGMRRRRHRLRSVRHRLRGAGHSSDYSVDHSANTATPGRKSRALVIFCVIAFLTVSLNILAWNSKAFCDAYIVHVLPLWVNTYGRFMDLFPFSVGELLLGVAAILVGIAAILWIFRIILRNRPGACRFIRGYYLFCCWTINIVALEMTLCCFIMYHSSTFAEMYFTDQQASLEISGEDGTSGAAYTEEEYTPEETYTLEDEYTLEELITVRNLVVEECNRLSQLMERDEAGNIVYDKDMGEVAILAMQTLGETYPRLSGYYPHPKPLLTSDFFSQQYICGYFFPFTMEANYNDVMYIMNVPATMCHELAHLKGYILEDEANFISFLACIGSDDQVFVYSGYLSVLNYLDNDFYKSVGKNTEAYKQQPTILSQVHTDNIFLAQEDWDRINETALIDTETVDQVSDTLMDVTLKANGVTDGIVSYSRVVELLLMYYRSIGVV